MKILSLFDGMACGMLALLECGITVERYVAYEIDEYAVKTSSHNFPIIEHRGDVFQGKFTEFRGFDFLMGGSPCTYWSIAQTKDRETVASGMGWELFCQYKRALDEAQPRYFIYENNKSMSAAIRESITETFGFEPVCINSALVSAQNRQRLYWVGRREANGTYSPVHVDQPEDMGILLRDVLDDAVAWQDKSFCITATECKGSNLKWTLTKHRRTMVAEPVAVNMQPMDRRRNENGDFDYLWEARTDGKASTITQVNTRRTVAEPVHIGTYPNNAKNQRHDSQQYRIYDSDSKSVTLCGNGGGMGAKTGLYAIPVEYGGDIPIFDRSGSDGKVYPVYKVEDGIITIKDKQYLIKLTDGYWIIRKLTVSECKRLQTVPEWYEFPVSDTQAYKMLGNGWTVAVIVHLLRAILKEKI